MNIMLYWNMQLGRRTMKFAVIGGDMRFVKLCEMLISDGNEVKTFALEKQNIDNVEHCANAREAAGDADCVILPVPVCAREGVLNAPLSGQTHTIEKIFAAAGEGGLVCGGKISQETKALGKKYGVRLVDYLEREEMAVANAGLAAEGAVQIIMAETPVSLKKVKCLVLGFGRLGKLVCMKLAAMGAEVFAAARSCEARAWIKELGYTWVDIEKAGDSMGDMNVIVNTIPARVIQKEKLKSIPREAFCLDLASRPGGLDFAAASKMGKNIVWALSLPGAVAPVTSGEIIRDTVYNIIREEKANTTFR